MSIEVTGHLEKMESTLDSEGNVDYILPMGAQRTPMNTLIGETIHLEFLGDIHCVHCGRRSKKSFSQGYCYPCFTRLPQCDTCIMSPEKCHFHNGTCRDPEWGEKHCRCWSLQDKMTTCLPAEYRKERTNCVTNAKEVCVTSARFVLLTANARDLTCC